MGDNRQPLDSIDATYKILILGDSGVGKTCTICRFCDQKFHECYVTSIGLDCKQRVIDLDGSNVRLRVWDTAGQERFRTLTQSYYRGAMGIILMYDITNLVTFNHITKWIESIENMAPPDTCTVLVGNKCDKYLCRAVDEERGKKLAENFGLDFFEASCKSNINVDQVFQHIATKIKDIKDKRAKRFQRTASNVSLTHWSMESGSHETKVFKCSC